MGEMLKPCPFCGSKCVKTFGPYGWYRQWGISHSCPSFYSGTQDMMQGFSTEEAAIVAWNRRVPPAPVDRDGVIHECADIALAIDSGRGNEREIAGAIRALTSQPSSPRETAAASPQGILADCSEPTEAQVERVSDLIEHRISSWDYRRIARAILTGGRSDG